MFNIHFSNRVEALLDQLAVAMAKLFGLLGDEHLLATWLEAAPVCR